MSSAFVSYSWDSESHREWVQKLSSSLRTDGIETILDQWHAIPGDNLPQFMETAIRENDFVIIICSTKYKRKADNREGGVGYEGDIMTGETFVIRNRRKFIPILREGDWAMSAPSWLMGTYYVDLRGDDWKINYQILLNTLHGRLPEPPPVIAQGFRILPDKSVLDTKNKLVWANCRDATYIVLENLMPLIQKISQQTGWEWRLPTDEEVANVKTVEEYYPRPPIMVEVDASHAFFGLYKKISWTDTIVSNVKEGDNALHAGGVFDANRFMDVHSGLAGILNVDSFTIAQEAEIIRRSFLARLVRPALEEDYKSSIFE